MKEVTLPFLSKLCPQAHVKVVAALMPRLTGTEISGEVRDYISKAIANDDF